ncbi:MAG: sulfite exporter TauE/SafE family protein [Gammaproteobacteria bacterium]|nr:sulfite exporter TauE/SafE family protein [Gammaproteobacteria bacterium]
MVGLMGGVHCVGMCGGIVAALSLGISQQKQSSVWPYLFAYNLARMTSYTIAGILVGGISWLGGQLVEVNQFQTSLQFMAGLFMIAMGLYVAGWWFGLAKVEQAGVVVWRYLEPVGRRCLPVKTIPQAFVLGLVWGWLPCGLVYSVLFWAIASGSPLDGGLLMLSFALGTLPNLLLMGIFASALNKFVKHVWVRRLAGSMIILFGIYSLLQAVIPATV